MRTVLFLLLACHMVIAADEVSWTRFKGRVKSINQKTSTITIQNNEGDLIGVKINGDVQIFDGKDPVPLGQVTMDQKVTLVYSPKPPAPKDDDDLPSAPTFRK